MKIKIINVRKLRNIVLMMVIMLMTAGLHAQQAPMFTNYSRSYAAVNPGFYGLSEGVNISSIYRDQYSGFDDWSTGERVSPRTFLISADLPIPAIAGGVGLSVVKDKTGMEDNVGVNLGYSYHLDLGSGTLGIGLALNLTNRSIDFSQASPIEEGDPSIPNSKQTDMLFDGNFGLFYMIPDQFYVAASVTNFLESKGKVLAANATSSASFVGDRTLYFVAGYEFHFTNSYFMLNPEMCLMSDIASTQFNIGAKLWYNEKFYFGTNYRFQESVAVMAGLNIKGFVLSYAYDINTMGHGVNGSHEVSLSYCFKLDLEKSPRIYSNVRYL